MGDVEKIGDFQEEKSIHMVPFLASGETSHAWFEKLYQGTRQGYLNENGNFKKGNQSCMFTEFHMGAILTKMTSLNCGN